jgi:hypothetical protein
MSGRTNTRRMHKLAGDAGRDLSRLSSDRCREKLPSNGDPLIDGYTVASGDDMSV